ncbi:MAG TPA: C1 family peptidase [Bryobacteraceae bacterium]|nr:C1 family peptidase [Bryobacteraceae bacterium]
MIEIPLEQAQDIAPFIPRLKALGYRTVNQFQAAVRAADAALSGYLGFSATELLNSIPKELRPVEFMGDEELPALSFGAVLHSLPEPEMAFAISPPNAAAPALVSLIDQMEPIRDQATRSTCTAFSSVAAAEHSARKAGAPVQLSEQFVYAKCKEIDGIPDKPGSWLRYAFRVLAETGCCLASTWPYNAADKPGAEGQGPPPTAALEEAAQHRFTSVELSPTAVLDIKGQLEQSNCVAFSIPVFDSWIYSREVYRTGEITLPVPGEAIGNLGHAMCMVGYEDLPDRPELGFGRFLLRNSWDSYWAKESIVGKPGYGTIPYAYIARHGKEAYAVV